MDGLNYMTIYWLPVTPSLLSEEPTRMVGVVTMFAGNIMELVEARQAPECLAKKPRREAR
jgi:hypothetical protein